MFITGQAKIKYTLSTSSLNAWAADNIATMHMPLYLLQYASRSHTNICFTTCFCTKDILREHSNKLCAWADDNLASLDIPFISVIE